ncbi:hypothetical protein ETR14_22035 [Sphingosinicella sp. BN140058]|nr:hypothetical protein ETR14_22035 [Sphingosinicella sp. BN140058]
MTQMFDSKSAFEKQFTRVDGGFLFYPSCKSGGKLITTEEYADLLADWERVAGHKGRRKALGVIGGAAFLWVLLSEAFSPPDCTYTAFTVAVALGAERGFCGRNCVRIGY